MNKIPENCEFYNYSGLDNHVCVLLLLDVLGKDGKEFKLTGGYCAYYNNGLKRFKECLSFSPTFIAQVKDVLEN